MPIRLPRRERSRTTRACLTLLILLLAGCNTHLAIEQDDAGPQAIDSGPLPSDPRFGSLKPCATSDDCPEDEMCGDENFICARMDDATLRCWGWPLGCVFGVNAPPSVISDPVPVPNVGDVAEVTSGGLVRKNDGSVLLLSSTCAPSSETTPFAEIRGAASVAGGRYAACVVNGAGAMQCMGTTPGDGSPGSDHFVPVHAPSGATHVGVGGAVDCASWSGGEVRCWGFSVGDGTRAWRKEPVLVQW